MRRLAKTLHAPTAVGGNPQGIARAERALGADSVSMCFRQNVYNNPADIVISTGNESWIRYLPDGTAEWQSNLWQWENPSFPIFEKRI